MEDRASRVGLDPIESVFLLENHDEAYHVWRGAAATSKVLVHVDAHHDLWWADGVESITIANFVSLAVQNGLVREMVWVVPDDTWRTTRGRAALRRHIVKVADSHRDGGSVHADTFRLSTTVLGKPLTVCSLDSLPSVGEGVLLDIDVDFLVIPRVSYGEADRHSALPWCWPGELLGRLRARRLRVDLATVAYSVEGGYTPLKWKYLGDELALRLRGPGRNSAIVAMERLRDGARSAYRGDRAAANDHYRLAAAEDPALAAPYFHLAHLCAAEGRIDEGRALYQEALTRDRSYRTPYGNDGFNCYWAGRVAEAEQEFRRTLVLDQEHAGALLGLGMIAARRKRWTDAVDLLQRSIGADRQLVDAYRELAAVLVQLDDHQGAIAAYERSLALAMAGHRPLGWLIATGGEAPRLVDSDHGKTHVHLARLYERRGDMSRAIAGYRIGIAGGHDGFALRCRLARLYLRRRQRRRAAMELGAAVTSMPFSLTQTVSRLRQRVSASVRRLHASARRERPAVWT